MLPAVARHLPHALRIFQAEGVLTMEAVLRRRGVGLFWSEGGSGVSKSPAVIDLSGAGEKLHQQVWLMTKAKYSPSWLTRKIHPNLMWIGRGQLAEPRGEDHHAVLGGRTGGFMFWVEGPNRGRHRIRHPGCSLPKGPPRAPDQRATLSQRQNVFPLSREMRVVGISTWTHLPEARVNAWLQTSRRAPLPSFRTTLN